MIDIFSAYTSEQKTLIHSALIHIKNKGSSIDNAISSLHGFMEKRKSLQQNIEKRKKQAAQKKASEDVCPECGKYMAIFYCGGLRQAGCKCGYSMVVE